MNANITDDRPHKPPMEREELREVISLSLWAGQMLLQWGADTARVEETVHRIGTGLGCDWLDIVVTVDAIIATTINNHEFRTKVRRAPLRGVNMARIVAINDVSYQIQQGACDRAQLRRALRAIDQQGHLYNRWLVLVGVALACAAFSDLFGGDAATFLATLGAAGTATFVRQELTKRYYNPLLIVIVVAAVAGGLASVLAHLLGSATVATAIAASVLLLVPGVPLINAAEDFINGYAQNGMVRAIYGGIISLAIALGLALVIWLTGVNGI